MIAPTRWQLFMPKLITILRDGYGMRQFRADTLAGLTVAIVAVPLAMALAIASGTTPEKGLVTAVIAGFLISLLGGSRVQIGGPTGAFVVVVYDVIAKHGFDGLVLSTMMAGAMLVLAGIFRLGTWIKYIPQPVITGFTAGIAVIIFSSQIKDIFGLTMDKVPGPFFEKWASFWDARETLNIWAVVLTAGALALILLLKRYAPSMPAYLCAVLGASAVAAAFSLPVTTIQSEFGGIPQSLPPAVWPEISLQGLHELLPSAFTIAFLAGIESLLCAVVADGLIGSRHRSNCELVAQGVANMASALFGGLPATGAIARTATNIRAGGRTPVAGMMHAVFVLLIMLLCAPLAAYVPLAALAAILVVIAWNMSEHDKITHMMKAPAGDWIVMILTFVLTVTVDLTVAIEVGVVMGAVLFMHRMSEAVSLQTHSSLIQKDRKDGGNEKVPNLWPHIEAYQIQGPLFFGVSGRLLDVLELMPQDVRVFILDLSYVPLIDASGEAALDGFLDGCRRRGVYVVLAGLHSQPRLMVERMGRLKAESDDYIRADDMKSAIAIAQKRLSILQGKQG